MTPEDRQALKRAHDLLEYPNLAVRLGNLVGTPLESVGKIVPVDWRRAIDDASHALIERLLLGAIRTLDPTIFAPATPARQRFLCAMSGAAGGTFGLPGVLVELPVTTTLMLRSIAATALAHGEDLNQVENRVACLQVLAFGGPTHRDDAAETGYYGVRLALAHQFSVMPERVAVAAGFSGSVPAAIELVQGIAARFGVAISQKVALQMTPVVGAVSGAAINMAFITHFQKVSEGHFVIRDLERRYGIAPVQAAYESLKAEMQSERAASAERFSWWPERPAGEPAAAQSTGQEAPEPEPELGPEPELEPERELELEPEPDVAATSPGPGVEEAVPPPARPDLAWLLEARRHLKIAQHDPGHIILRFSPAILGCVPQLAGGDAEALWRGVKGIEAMRINVWKRSIVLDYDPSVIATSVWSDLLEGDDPVARQRLFDLVH